MLIDKDEIIVELKKLQKNFKKRKCSKCRKLQLLRRFYSSIVN